MPENPKRSGLTQLRISEDWLAAYFAGRQEAGAARRPSLRLVWERFPKFALGFVVASIPFSLEWIDGGKGSAIDALKNWAFTLASGVAWALFGGS